MRDHRIEKLAQTLVHHSCRLQSGQKVMIEAFDLPDPALVCRLIDEVYRLGATPLVSWKSNQVLRSLYRNATDESMSLPAKFEAAAMSEVDAYIGIRGSANSNEFADVSAERMDLYQKHWWQPVHINIRVPKTRWVVLRYPTPSFAQAAGRSCEDFEDFYFDVCTTDYAQMASDLRPLKARMEAADQVRITARDTDLTFSIKDIPVVPCAGECNIPDGECFTAPVKNSVNGVITFNTASRYQGVVFEGIRFEFVDGKIVNATCRNAPDRLNKILDSDEGARYIANGRLGQTTKSSIQCSIHSLTKRLVVRSI